MPHRARAPLCLALLLSLLLAAPVLAQPQRTFVASTGLDTNPCSRTAPCRNFAAAVAAVASGGEVIVLDSAGYGPVTIGQPVSLTAPSGVYAGVAAPGTLGITINAPGSTVALRGLSINGSGTSVGILVQAAGVVHVENTTVSNFSSGLEGNSDGMLFVDDSVFRSNSNGLFVTPVSGVATASIDHCRFEQNANNGVFVQGSGVAGTTVFVRDSLMANNTARAGIVAIEAEVNVKNCVSTNNTTGLLSSTGGTVSSVNSTLTDNATGIGATSTFKSFGDNVLYGNTAAVTGTLTPVAKQ